MVIHIAYPTKFKEYGVSFYYGSLQTQNIAYSKFTVKTIFSRQQQLSDLRGFELCSIINVESFGFT